MEQNLIADIMSSESEETTAKTAFCCNQTSKVFSVLGTCGFFAKNIIITAESCQSYNSAFVVNSTCLSMTNSGIGHFDGPTQAWFGLVVAGTILGIGFSSISFIIKLIEEVGWNIGHPLSTNNQDRNRSKTVFNLLNKALLIALTAVDATADKQLGSQITRLVLLAVWTVFILLDIFTAKNDTEATDDDKQCFCIPTPGCCCD